MVTARRPEPTPLTGDFVRLEPFTTEHIPALYRAIGHPAVFEFGFGGGPAAFPSNEDEFALWCARYELPKNNRYVVILVAGPHDGEVVGTTTLGDFDEARETTHIGWTGYDPRVWGTAVNPETKLLLLDLAFDSGFGRVRLQTDVLNLRSREAIARLGAAFEGVVRREQRRADGTWRDTALFSIIVEEWPECRAALVERLRRHAGRPVLFRTPPKPSAGL